MKSEQDVISLDIDQEQHKLSPAVQEILRMAEHRGADMAEVSVGVAAGLSVALRSGELETVEFNKDKGFGITVYFGYAKGYAATSDNSLNALKKTVDAACDIAKYTQEDPFSGLADASLMAQDLRDLDLYHPWPITVEQAIDLARICEKAALSLDPKISMSDGVHFNTVQSARIYANSHGFVGKSMGTRHSLSCSMIAEEKAGMQRDGWYTVDRDREKLQSPEIVGRMAAERAVARLGSEKISTGTYPVVFSAEAASGLFSSLLNALSGSAQYKRSTFLLDSIGDRVFSEDISIVEKPHLSGALGSATFDSEGVGTWEKAFVRNGVVNSYVLGSYSARKLGLETTGNAGGVHNVFIEGEEKERSEMIRLMGTGLLITGLIGQGINPVTGDYSRGASGFWVEGGKIVHAVDGVTIASNLKQMFQDIVAVGSDRDFRKNIVTGSVLLRGVKIAAN